jgi:hypothetical protein
MATHQSSHDDVAGSNATRFHAIVERGLAFRMTNVHCICHEQTGCFPGASQFVQDNPTTRSLRLRRGFSVQIVLIDAFVVPDESKAAFLETSRAIQDVLKRLPGFVEGFLHEKRAGDRRYDIVTTAVWEDEKAFENAKRVIPMRLQKSNINPGARMKALNVQIERGVYTRSSY